jgi:hypothetical protein
MGKKTIVALLIGLALAVVPFAEAQQPKKVPRIGSLFTTAGATPVSSKHFVTGSGISATWRENVIVEYRYTERQDLTTELATELVLKVDLTVASTTPQF